MNKKRKEKKMSQEQSDLKSSDGLKPTEQKLLSIQKRFREKVINKAVEYAPWGWEYWIKPIEVISLDDKKMILHHPGDEAGTFMNTNLWTMTHYGELIYELLNNGVENKIAIEFTS